MLDRFFRSIFSHWSVFNLLSINDFANLIIVTFTKHKYNYKLCPYTSLLHPNFHYDSSLRNLSYLNKTVFIILAMFSYEMYILKLQQNRQKLKQQQQISKTSNSIRKTHFPASIKHSQHIVVYSATNHAIFSVSHVSKLP